MVDFNKPRSSKEMKKLIKEQHGWTGKSPSMKEVQREVTSWDDDKFVELTLWMWADVDGIHLVLDEVRKKLLSDAKEQNETELVEVWKAPLLKTEVILWQKALSAMMDNDEFALDVKNMIIENRKEPSNMMLWILSKISMLRENQEFLESVLKLENELNNEE